MSEAVQQIFNSFHDYLYTVKYSRKDIRIIVRAVNKSAVDIATILMKIRNENEAENTVAQNFARARKLFEIIRTHYTKLAEIVGRDQYYRYDDQWKHTTRNLCFLSGLTAYLEVKVLMTKNTAGRIVTVKSKPGDGLHLNIEDAITRLLQLTCELVRLAADSFTNDEFNRPAEIVRNLNELLAEFLLPDPKKKRYDALKNDVKKAEEVVYDLSIRGLNPRNAEAPQFPNFPSNFLKILRNFL